MTNFYVYVHYQADSDIPFYVGKGFGRRAYKKTNRSEFWKNVEKKHGCRVEILHQNLSEEEAFLLEKTTIQMFGRRNVGSGPLVNLTDGGVAHRGLFTAKRPEKK